MRHERRPLDDVDVLVDGMNSTGFGVMGTPEMAVEQIHRIQEASGGFDALPRFEAERAAVAVGRRTSS